MTVIKMKHKTCDGLDMASSSEQRMCWRCCLQWVLHLKGNWIKNGKLHQMTEALMGSLLSGLLGSGPQWKKLCHL